MAGTWYRNGKAIDRVKKVKKGAACALAPGVICMFTGCSLALPEAEAESKPGEDRLAGVFLTEEHLDREALLTDAEHAAAGGAVRGEGDGSGCLWTGRVMSRLASRKSSMGR